MSRRSRRWLNVQGIRLSEVRVVADVEAAIVEAVNALRGRARLSVHHRRDRTDA